jgi:methylated-DNA-[protein]-cysteine S-methyltransferase
MFYDQFDSPLGAIRSVSDGAALSGLYFIDERHAPKPAPDWRLDPRHVVLRACREQIEEYFSGERTCFDLPLAASGTQFQRAVWQALGTIPFGETWSYSQIAVAVGAPKAVRAVGAANGANPISIVVPCHRVIGADGSLTGYAGGLARKRALLELEGALATKVNEPQQLSLLA